MVWNSLKKLSKEAARLPWCSMRSAFGCIILHKFIMKRKTFRHRQNTVADAIWTTSNYTETCFQFEPSASVPNFLKKKYRKKKKKEGNKGRNQELENGCDCSSTVEVLRNSLISHLKQKAAWSSLHLPNVFTITVTTILYFKLLKQSYFSIYWTWVFCHFDQFCVHAAELMKIVHVHSGPE